jgi:hypothetical protein
MRRGAVVSYVKIAQDEPIAALLRHEAGTLAWLYSEGFSSKSLPQVQALEDAAPFTLLFLSPPDQPARQRPSEPDARDAGFLSDLASLNVSRAGVAEIFDQQAFDTYVQLIAAHDPESAVTLRAAMQLVIERFGSDGVSATPCHGDYGPWNTLELADGRVFVIDWEYGERRAPALTDLFHRLLMPACYVLNYSPRRVVEKLLSVRRSYKSCSAELPLGKSLPSDTSVVYRCRSGSGGRNADEHGRACPVPGNRIPGPRRMRSRYASAFV